MLNSLSLTKFIIFLGILSVGMASGVPNLIKRKEKGAKVLLLLILTVFEPMLLIAMGMRFLENNRYLLDKYRTVYKALRNINLVLCVLLVLEFWLLYKVSDGEEKKRQGKVYKVLFIIFVFLGIVYALTDYIFK